MALSLSLSLSRSLALAKIPVLTLLSNRVLECIWDSSSASCDSMLYDDNITCLCIVDSTPVTCVYVIQVRDPTVILIRVGPEAGVETLGFRRVFLLPLCT